MTKNTPSSRKQTAHFLHVGKTGGTAVKEALGSHLDSGRYTIKLHRHKTTLADVPKGEKVFFFLRDPISRFVSGFYSRYRKGAPRYNRPWNKKEEHYFTLFQSANKLAHALSSPDTVIQEQAQEAMHAINHVRSCYYDWFLSTDFFVSRIDDILFAGYQETLSTDFNSLKKKLCLNHKLSLPTSPVKSHKTPQTFDMHLDKKAIAALQKHYAKDLNFLKICKRLKLNRISAKDRLEALLWNYSPLR